MMKNKGVLKNFILNLACTLSEVRCSARNKDGPGNYMQVKYPVYKLINDCGQNKDCIIINLIDPDGLEIANIYTDSIKTIVQKLLHKGRFFGTETNIAELAIKYYPAKLDKDGILWRLMDNRQAVMPISDIYEYSLPTGEVLITAQASSLGLR